MKGRSHALLARKQMVRDEQLENLAIHAFGMAVLVMLAMGLMPWGRSSNTPSFFIMGGLAFASLGTAASLAVFAFKNWRAFSHYERSLY